MNIINRIISRNALLFVVAGIVAPWVGETYIEPMKGWGPYWAAGSVAIVAAWNVLLIAWRNGA